MADGVAGIDVPDTRLVREATELVRDASDELIYHHSRRVYLFGSLFGRRNELSYDAELVYVGAMFHDLGPTQRYRTADRRFELDGAQTAAEFLRAHELSENAVGAVWQGIALHSTPETAVQRAAVVAAHPRPDFVEAIYASDWPE